MDELDKSEFKQNLEVETQSLDRDLLKFVVEEFAQRQGDGELDLPEKIVAKINLAFAQAAEANAPLLGRELVATKAELQAILTKLENLPQMQSQLEPQGRKGGPIPFKQQDQQGWDDEELEEEPEKTDAAEAPQVKFQGSGSSKKKSKTGLGGARVWQFACVLLAGSTLGLGWMAYTAQNDQAGVFDDACKQSRDATVELGNLEGSIEQLTQSEDFTSNIDTVRDSAAEERSIGGQAMITLADALLSVKLLQATLSDNANMLCSKAAAPAP